MILLSIVLQTASAPPILPPPSGSLAAASALWADHPPTDLAKQAAIDNAVSTTVNEALYRVGIQPSHNLAVTKRYLAKYDQLRPLVARQVKTAGAAFDRSVAECAIEQIARTLTPEEIETVRTFMSAPTGRKFWSASGLSYWSLNGCYQSVLDLKVTDAEYRAVGLNPPPPPKQPDPRTIVYR